MGNVDSSGRRCDRSLQVHVRRVGDVDYDIHKAIQYAQRLYARYGISVRVASLETVHLPPETAAYSGQLESKCQGSKFDEKQAELYEWFGVQDFSSVMVFVIASIKFPPTSQYVNGCAAHPPHRPAAFVSSRDGNETTVAHELGHILLGEDYDGEHHVVERNNVMERGYKPTDTQAFPQFDAKQLLKIRGSRLLQPC